MSIYSTKQIDTNHQDLIQDIAYDFFGKRVATASLDQMVIWPNIYVHAHVNNDFDGQSKKVKIWDIFWV